MKAELERLAERVAALSVREDTDGGSFCAQYEQRRIERELRALAARCDNNPTEEKEVMRSAGQCDLSGSPSATKPPASEAGGDQPAGEPVPLPEPAEDVKQGEGREGVEDQLVRELAEDNGSDYTQYEQGRIAEKRRCIDLLRAERLASAQQAGVPAMDDEVRWILGQPNFACISYANALRRLGHSIPNKSEEEQAAVIHWMLTVYAQHGDSWREEGAKILRGQRTGSRGEVGE